MAKFCIYSDIHFYHQWPEFNHQVNGVPLRLTQQLDVFYQIQQIALQNNCTAVLFAGDLIHKRSFMHTQTYSALLNALKGTSLPQIMIPGNHDRFDQNHDAVTPLDGIQGIRVVNDNPVGFGENIRIYGATPGGVLPTPEPGPHKNILLAHGCLQGAKNQSGFEFVTGYTQKDFEGWDLVVLGDIHKRQVHGNVLIPGSPLEMNWGDSGGTFGCWILSTIPEPAVGPNATTLPNGWTLAFHELKAPKHIVVTSQNLESIFQKATQPDTLNYYDFRLCEALTTDTIAELRAILPNSYFTLKEEGDKAIESRLTNTQTATPEELLAQYFDFRWKEGDREGFLREGFRLLSLGSQRKSSGGQSQLVFRKLTAQNFLSLQEAELDLTKLTQPVYQVTGVGDEETSANNGVGKSSLIVELILYTLYGKLARSSTRSMDGVIHDPQKTGKAKNLFTEVELSINGVIYKIQRYRKHALLGTGCRILQQAS